MKKFMLVPSNALNAMQSPLSRKLGELDAEMKEILENQDMGEHTKASLYQNVLDKYLNVRRKIMEPHPIPIVERKLGEMVPSQRIDLEIFPKNYRSRASQLLNHIQSSSGIGWNDRGELLLSGQPIMGSHIVDLVGDLVKPKMKHSVSPKGVNDLVDALHKSNVPMSLIGNKGRFSKGASSLDDSLSRGIVAHSTPKGRIFGSSSPPQLSPTTTRSQWLKY